MFDLLIIIVIVICIVLAIFLIMGKYTTLDPNKMMSIEDYAATNDLNSDEVIEKIRDGQYRGQLIKGKWHIYVPDEDNDH